MTGIAELTVSVLRVADAPLLGRLLQLYLHDFSGFADRASPRGEVDETGLFAYPPGLDGCWRDPGRIPVLIRADGRIAGFALVNGWSPLGTALDHALAEFFVLRKFRRAGVGRRAALAIFRAFPGRWQLGIAAYNAPALLFWRSVAVDIPGADERQGDPDRWTGRVLCFTSAGAA